jgi:hypothetical protein
MNRAWERPKLVVLVRAKPEETILNACKMSGSSASAADFRDGCDFEPLVCEERGATGIGDSIVVCGACSEPGVS